jgi:hypothetical protein
MNDGALPDDYDASTPPPEPEAGEERICRRCKCAAVIIAYKVTRDDGQSGLRRIWHPFPVCMWWQKAFLDLADPKHGGDVSIQLEKIDDE